MYAWLVKTPNGERLLDCGPCVVKILQSCEEATAEHVELYGEQVVERCPE